MLGNIKYDVKIGQPQGRIESDFRHFGYDVIKSNEGHNAIKITNKETGDFVIVECYLLYRCINSNVIYKIKGKNTIVQYSDILNEI